MYHQRKLKIQIHLATKLAFQKQQRKQTVTLLQNLAEETVIQNSTVKLSKYCEVGIRL